MWNEEELNRLSQEELKELLRKNKEALEDLDLEWEMNFSLTGVHINPGELQRLQSRLAEERKRIEQKVELIKAALEEK